MQKRTSFIPQSYQRTPIEDLNTIIIRFFANSPGYTTQLSAAENYFYGPQGVRKDRKEVEHYYFLGLITRMIFEGILHPSSHRSSRTPDLYFFDRVCACKNYL